MKTHHCNEVDCLASSEAFSIDISKADKIWFLTYKSLATEYDVRSREAEKLGEVMHTISLQIKYCPFCGQRID